NRHLGRPLQSRFPRTYSESVRSEPGQEPHPPRRIPVDADHLFHHNKVTRLMKILAKQVAGEVAKPPSMVRGTEMTRRGTFRTMSGMHLGEKKHEQNGALNRPGAA